MESPERVEASTQAPAGEDVKQTSLQHPEAQSRSLPGQERGQYRLETDGLELQQPWRQTSPAFQDSNLSPALHLLPMNSALEHNFTEYSLFHQSDHEFAPLRAYPDISMASERFHCPPRESSVQASSECGSLSQHPLAQETILSEEGASSSCSLSQHSLSPGDVNKGKVTAQIPPISPDATQGASTIGDSDTRKRELKILTDSQTRRAEEMAEDETFFLNKDVPAQHLLDLLQKDFGMPSSSSSAVSSASETSVKTAASLAEEAKCVQVNKPSIDQSSLRREGPTGEVCPPQQQRQKPDRDSPPNQSKTLSSEVCNITTGSRSTQPDESSEVLHRELLSEVERRNRDALSPTPPGQSLTPFPTKRHEVKPSVTKTSVGGLPWTGPFSTGVERGHKDQDLWSSGNQTGIDGSYLGFLPQSQSTPGVFRAPPKSSVKIRLGQLSDIESSQNSRQSSTGISSHHAVPVIGVHGPEVASQSQEEATSAKVQSLPSLNFMEKVDAWRANQNSGKTSLFDSLALQGFSGVSPKKKAYDVVSDSLNRILSQQAKGLQQPPVSSAANLNVTQSSSTAPSASSSSKRGEAVGSAPSDKDKTVSAVGPSASPYGRSQSHSSISTVVASTKKDQQTETAAVNRNTSVQHSPFMSLGQFSDVSLDLDSTLSSSQGSNNSGLKPGTSIGASSAVSLEVDNYAPYWTSKLSTPPPQPKQRELNIEERIPLYLRNLGIDQSPSTILTPFVPKGPIREPEFSPTDLCTIKGSIGTPTKSAQPSEGGSPQKGEFSRCSVLSVDSSVSVPFSLDSLGPSVSIPERPRRASPLSDTYDAQSERRLAASPQPDEDSYPSTLQSTLQQQQQRDSSQSTIQSGERFESELLLSTNAETDLESPLQTSRSMERSAADSFVSSNALLEIRKLLSQADNVISTGSSVTSSPAAPRLLSDNDIFLSLRKKTSTLQDPSFSSSSATEDPRSRSSLLWARSSSDSLLTSDKVRGSSIGRESTASPGQQNYPATQAPAAAAHRSPPDNIVSPDAGPPFVLSQSARRAEPEGCSAAPPDNTVTKPLPAPSPAPLTSTPPDTAGVTEEETQTTPDSPAPSSFSSPVSEDQGGMSDGSSESSLAVRVAKLLQSESPSTMVSSTASMTDQEESKAREWIKLKLSGQKCEPLLLDQEDRRRIEEIKRELLLKNPIKSRGSTDTESSASSSVRGPGGGRDQTHQPSADKQASQLQQGLLGTDLSDPSTHPQNLLPSNLEVQVQEIAAREEVTLSRTKPLALTSITIATRRRSTSPSPSTSPAPPLSPAPGSLRLEELSAANIREENKTTRDPNLTPQSAPSIKKRQDTVGGQLEEDAPLSSQGLGGADVNSKDTQDSQASGVKELTGSPTSESSVRTGHVSHVHLTLSPKSDTSVSAAVPSAHADAGKKFVSLRHSSSSAASSLDEGVGLSSPPDWYDNKELVKQRSNERADTSTVFKQASKFSQSSTVFHKVVAPTRPFTTETPVVPVLLPYKPRGSEELFYVPQTKADASSTDHSDTTMESSHPGSDDAVPPHFSSEVLGHRDPGLDRGVSIRHSEGIYSKRFKTATFRMQEPERRGVSVSADKTSQTSASQKPGSSQVSVAFTRVPLSSNQETSRRDQGTSPVQFLSQDHPGPSHGRFQPLHVDPDYSRMSHHRGQNQETVDSDVPHFTTQPSSSGGTLDQLWQRFCDRWSQEESRPTRDREASLLERLERLSQIIQSTRTTNVSGANDDEEGREEEDAAGKGRKRVREVRRSRKEEVSHQTWTPSLQVAETSRPADEERRDSSSAFSSFSHDSSLSPHLGPADRDDSETVSSRSGSMSTIDTARLIRAFGAHRVRHLKTSSSLSKLYGAIDRQREGREERRGGNKEAPHNSSSISSSSTLSETNLSHQSSITADSASSTSTYTLPSHHGPSRTLAAKKAVKLVNKSIQAGDLELVSNVTRRHTRDVGTTFPSPGEARTSRRISSPSSSVEGGRGGKKSPSKTHGPQKHRKSKKSPSKTVPQGVSWFISADELRSESRKENRPEEEEPPWRPSTAWFEPYSRTKPWREPLRQRQIYEDENSQPSFRLHDDLESDPSSKVVSSGLARVSLQEALEARRPDFISQSRQRVKRLALQAEERKLQADFSREREELFSRPGGPGRLPRPAGTALLRRAVPRKEMIQRSKQIYESLPEVQRRREEERRKAEYRSYRLNAQLYNKRITSRVLGRRTAWD
ncbi:Alstrom syndrome protein 1 homolog [Xyrichtys novacula]|uniref:Alstrom syndrome protein 1 homolog n=2 Tax=Xyrichtys novacula TaxID=13765 RepID=A0AAV1GR92_XYRNO|nr:Alstrom syndrome protein 1 homolog [Xyrichtys novacula]